MLSINIRVYPGAPRIPYCQWLSATLVLLKMGSEEECAPWSPGVHNIGHIEIEDIYYACEVRHW